MSLRHHLERVKPNALPAPSALVLGLALFAAALTVLPRGWVVEVGRPAKALILLFGLALALPLALQRSVGRRAAPIGWTGAALLFLVGLALARWPAASDGGLALERLGSLVLLAGAFVTVRLGLAAREGARCAAQLERFLLAAGVGVALAGLLALGPARGLLPAVDSGASTFGTRNLGAGFAALVLPLAWPAAGGLDRRRAAVFVLCAAYVIASGNRLALLAGGVACALLAARDVRSRRALAWGAGAALVLLSAFALRAPASGSTTVLERLHLWDASLELVAEAPLAGQGPGQWAVHYPRAAADEAEVLARRSRYSEGPSGFITVRGFRQPAHAHQDYLELAVELGVLAALLFTLALGAGAWSGLRGPMTRARAGAGCAAFGVLALGVFPLAEPVSAASLGVLLALSLPPPAAARTGSRAAAAAPRLAAVGLSTAAVLLTAHSIRGLGAELHYQAAFAHEARLEHAAAAERCAVARALAPGDFRLPLLQTYALAASRETEAAREAAERALALRPHSPNALNNLGLILQRQGRLAEAERALQRARTLMPGDPHVNVNLGSLLVARGRPAEARPCFQRALAENPNIFQAWEGLAKCAVLEDEPLELLACLEQARAARLRCRIAVAAAAAPGRAGSEEHPS